MEDFGLEEVGLEEVGCDDAGCAEVGCDGAGSAEVGGDGAGSGGVGCGGVGWEEDGCGSGAGWAHTALATPNISAIVLTPMVMNRGMVLSFRFTEATLAPVARRRWPTLGSRSAG